MYSDDITFCMDGWESCKNTRCERHPENIIDKRIPHSYANLYQTPYCPLYFPAVVEKQYETIRVPRGHGKLIDADALIRDLSVDPYECPGCPEPEFLQDLINVLESAPSITEDDA